MKLKKSGIYCKVCQVGSVSKGTWTFITRGSRVILTSKFKQHFKSANIEQKIK